MNGVTDAGHHDSFCHSYFSIAVIKCLKQNQLEDRRKKGRKEGRKSYQWQLERAGHIAVTVKEHMLRLLSPFKSG